MRNYSSMAALSSPKFFCLPVLAALALSATLGAAEKNPSHTELNVNYNIPLWEPARCRWPRATDRWTTRSSLSSCPPKASGTAASVIVAPGGSNIMLMYGAEGMDIAERYNDWGVAAFVLTYRLSPRYGEDARVLDGKRAMQLVRSRAAECKLDPEQGRLHRFFSGLEPGAFRGGASGPGDPNAADPDRPLEFAAGLSGAGIWPRAALRRANRSRDFPPTFLLRRRSRYRAVAGLRAVVSWI